MNRTFTVVHGSLTDGASALLVNASNTNANLGSGVSGAIRAACGAGYQQHIHDELQARKGGPMEQGDVLVTDAGTHPTARYVAHVAVMDYRHGFTGQSYPSLALLDRAYANLWQAIETIDDPSPISVAVVALGAGTGNVGLRNSVELACKTLAAHLERTADSRIGDLTFYGCWLPEYLATLDVVVANFPVDEATIPEGAREFLRKG
jgi:O-acetyl-ADP-ribose deacetylase (regulator of RNase III)